jgi:putative salt-induced outer membrane protein YdiY
VAGVNVGAARAVIDADADGVPEGFADTYTENARKLYVDTRYDRFLTDKDSLYVLGGAFHDRFAGYDIRAHEQIGYSRLLVKNESSELRAEIGADWAQEDYFENPDPNYQNVIAARLLLGLAHKFSEAVAITDTAEVYENVVDVDDVRVLNTAALTSALSGKLSVKVSHALIFDNVPVEGFRSLDQTAMVTLVVSLL